VAVTVRVMYSCISLFCFTGKFPVHHVFLTILILIFEKKKKNFFTISVSWVIRK
jgi:hypothetical protein